MAEESGSRSSLRKSPRKQLKRKVYGDVDDNNNEDDYDVEDEEDVALVFDDGIEQEEGVGGYRDLAILAASVNASAQAAEASASSEGNTATGNNSKSIINAKGSSGELLLASSSVNMRVDVDAIKNNDATDNNRGGNNGNPNELIDVEKQVVNDKCFFGNCPKECNRGDLSTVAMLGKETNELVELLSDARQRLAMAEEISREHDYRRSLFEDCEVNESASYYT